MKSPHFRRSLLTASVLLLTACATTGNETERRVIIDIGCLWAHPIMVSKDDTLTDGTAKAILAHNEIWKERCAHDRAEG